jgi:uncharacterized protein (TIGR02271 family)
MTSDGATSGSGDSRSPNERDNSVVLHEEQASVAKRWEGVGSLHARRVVERGRVRAKFPREREELVQERVPVSEGDSGEIEILPDGSVSIPLFEEELVIRRETVLRERVIIRKENVTEQQRVQAELRRERVEFDQDDSA